jgi:hypothetical protein
MICNYQNDVLMIAGCGLSHMDVILGLLRTDSLQRLCFATVLGTWIPQQQFHNIYLSIRDNSRNLKELIFFLGARPLSGNNEERYQPNFLRVDSNLSDSVHFSTQITGSPAKWASYVTLVEAAAQRVRASFSLFLKSDGLSWTGLNFDVCILAVFITIPSRLVIIQWFVHMPENGPTHYQNREVPIARWNVRDCEGIDRYHGIARMFSES